MRNVNVSAFVLVFLAAALIAPAQVGLNGVKAGLGTMTLGPVNTNALNGGNGELGIQYYPGDGRFYVSRRGVAASTAAPHSLLVIDQNGVLVTTIVQGPGAAGGVWGHRDGATDGYVGGTKLFWGDDFGIHCYEMSSGLPVYVTGAQTVMSANGPQTCTFPLAVQGQTGGITRALEYNPNGNGGNGSFWCGNFGVSLVEVNLAGATLGILSPAVNPGMLWSAYGLAMDLQNGMLWVNSHIIGSTTVLAEVAELNPATGVYTGRRIRPAGSLTVGPWLYAAQGGLCYVQGRSGPTFGPATTPPYGELAVLSQGTPDYYALHRLDLAQSFVSELEPKLEVSLNGGAYSSANQSFAVGATLEMRYNTPVANPGSPALLLVNAGLPAASIPSGNTVNVAELIILNNLSVPTAASVPVIAASLGDGFGLGGLLAADLLIMTGTTVPLITSIPVPIPMLGPPGTALNLQAVYLSTLNAPTATNFITLTQL